jgi:ferredoxin-NADP reductase
MRVKEVKHETVDVISIYLENPDEAPLPMGLAGQFLVVRVRTAPGQASLLRNYSISGMPGPSTYRISVKHEVSGTVSSYLHGQVQAGSLLEVSAPRGNFTLNSGDGPIVLLSAGIGATPVLAMLHALCLETSRREVWWIYGARNRAEHPFANESRELLEALANGRSHIVYSKPASEDNPGLDYDSVGHVDTPLIERLGVSRDSDFYLCGPPSFLNQLTKGLAAWGVSLARIHAELFESQAPITPGITRSSRPPAHPPAGTPGNGPQISFTRSGLTVAWDPRFPNLLELAEACDIPVQWSCRAGVCHTCECALIGGSVEYQPEPLEPPAVGDVLICCSKPTGDVQLDL